MDIVDNTLTRSIIAYAQFVVRLWPVLCIDEGICNKSLNQNSKTKSKLASSFLHHAYTKCLASLKVVGRHKTRSTLFSNRLSFPPSIILQAKDSKDISFLEAQLLRYLCCI
jgi:hypothetical protein